jgi:hypothetical protein
MCTEKPVVVSSLLFYIYLRYRTYPIIYKTKTRVHHVVNAAYIRSVLAKRMVLGWSDIVFSNMSYVIIDYIVFRDKKDPIGRKTRNKLVIFQYASVHHYYLPVATWPWEKRAHNQISKETMQSIQLPEIVVVHGFFWFYQMDLLKAQTFTLNETYSKLHAWLCIYGRKYMLFLTIVGIWCCSQKANKSTLSAHIFYLNENWDKDSENK